MFRISNIFRIDKTTNLSRKIEYQYFNGVKLIKRLPAVTGNENVMINVVKTSQQNRFEAYLRSNCILRPIGIHNYDINQSEKIMFGNTIDVVDSHNRRKGYGEIMRLASIIEMLENNLDEIFIEAAPSAIPFHFKYKFEPDKLYLSDIAYILKEISESKSLGNFRELAKRKLKKLEELHKREDNYQEDCRKFITKFIKHNIPKWKENDIHWSIPMRLTKQTVKQNASYFNKLLKKHEIDYHI